MRSFVYSGLWIEELATPYYIFKEAGKKISHISLLVIISLTFFLQGMRL